MKPATLGCFTAERVKSSTASPFVRNGDPISHLEGWGEGRGLGAAQVTGRAEPDEPPMRMQRYDAESWSIALVPFQLFPAIGSLLQSCGYTGRRWSAHSVR